MPMAPRRSGGQPKGFFGSLFDLSFENFVATKLVKVLFVLGIIVAALYAIGIVVMLLSAGISASAIRGGPGSVVVVGAVIGALILAPLVFFLMVLGSRIWCEVLIVMFRIAEHTGEIAEQGRNRS
jgi:hypothetical protein